MNIQWTDEEKKMGCVIVDDDLGVCAGLEFGLKHDLGLKRVISFTEPREALQYFKDNAREVDVVLLDLSMPEIDGVEMLIRIREYDSAIQVVVVSAYAGQDAVIETLRSLGLAPNRIITKPATSESLGPVLRNAYQKSRKLRTEETS